MRASKKISIFLMGFALQSCCMFGTHEAYRSTWTATKNPAPLYGVGQQSQLCVVEDKKACIESNRLLCADIESGQHKIKPIHSITGEEITGEKLKRLQENCKILQSKPEQINRLCKDSTIPSHSCMEKNGYKYDHKTVTECSSMKVL